MSYEIRVDPAAARYVVRGFFTIRELPQAVARALFTREFLVLVVAPVALAVASHFAARIPLLVAAAAWMLAGLAWSLRAGKNVGIGCFADGRLVGGLLVKRARARITLSGVIIDPAHRGAGIFPALLLAAFRLAGPGTTIAVFGTAHPASKHVVEKYLYGHRSILVDPSPGTPYSRSLALLESEASSFRFDVNESIR